MEYSSKRNEEQLRTRQWTKQSSKRLAGQLSKVCHFVPTGKCSQVKTTAYKRELVRRGQVPTTAFARDLLADFDDMMQAMIKAEAQIKSGHSTLPQARTMLQRASEILDAAIPEDGRNTYDGD